MSEALQIIATMVAQAGKQDDLRLTLTAAVGEFRAEPGCLGYVLLQDKKQPGRFMTYETWTDETALAQHMESPAMNSLAPTMKTLLADDIKQDFLAVLRSC